MSQAFGAHALGAEPLSGDPLHDPPTVTMDPLGSITTGGPSLEVSWTFDQPQSDAQEQFRVLITNDAKTTTYYDSGWQFGADTSFSLDVDESGLVPHESDDITVLVQARGPEAIGTGDLARYQNESEEAIEIHWGVPHCTILAPLEGAIVKVTGSTVNVTWQFSDDDVSNTQGAYRVRITLVDLGLVLVDTGWVVSAASGVNVPLVMQDGWRYEIEVQLKNNHGIRSD